MDRFADQVHSHAGADRCDIKGAQHFNDRFQRRDHFIGGHIDFCMVAAYILSNFLCVFKVNGVAGHSYRESADRLVTLFLGNGADEG